MFFLEQQPSQLLRFPQLRQRNLKFYYCQIYSLLNVLMSQPAMRFGSEPVENTLPMGLMHYFFLLFLKLVICAYIKCCQIASRIKHAFFVDM